MFKKLRDKIQRYLTFREQSSCAAERPVLNIEKSAEEIGVIKWRTGGARFPTNEGVPEIGAMEFGVVEIDVLEVDRVVIREGKHSVTQVSTAKVISLGETATNSGTPEAGTWEVTIR